MRWPGDFTAHRLVRSGPLRVLAAWIGGFSAIAEPEAGDISERELGRIRARQMDAVRQLTPVTMTVNLINVAIVLGLFWNAGSRMFLGLWAIGIASAALLALRSWMRSRQIRPEGSSLRGMRRMTLQAFFLAAIWGALPLALLDRVAPSSQMIVACLMAGMIAGGAVTLSTVPRAGLVYTWTLAFASAASLVVAGDKVHLFTAIFLLALYRLHRPQRRLARQSVLENLQAQFKLERQTEIISLLLKEFQENASDWLWQTDAEGRLTYVPDRFAEVAQIPRPLLQGAHLSEVLEMLCPDDAITASNIAALMARRAPLHEMSVRVVAGGETRLWSLTAKPRSRRRRPLSSAIAASAAT